MNHPMLPKIKQFARRRGLSVTWGEVRGAFRSELDALPPHQQRRLRVTFEGWITRNRLDETEGAAE